jgi:hypothetical protein
LLLDTFSGERRRGHAHQCTEIFRFGQVVAERPHVPRGAAALTPPVAATAPYTRC